MVFEKIGMKLGMLGKTEEQKHKYARLVETKEHLDKAYKDCKGQKLYD